jgi:CRISPR-associated endonuclease/helicase Cas3
VFHLSTLLCGAHRKQVLEEIRQRLKGGLPVRLVSTQVVEAGVDLDFPLVLRALGPLDRIVQAAGRCNREGRLRDAGGVLCRGRVVVFEPAEGGVPPGEYRTAVGTTRSFLAGGRTDLYLPAAHRDYFRRLYQGTATDRTVRGSNTTLQQLRVNLSFEQVAQLGSLIDQGPTEGLVVPFGPGKALAEAAQGKLRAGVPLNRQDYRALQPYTVNLAQRKADALRHLYIREGDLLLWTGRYDELRGLVEGRLSPDEYCV